MTLGISSDYRLCAAQRIAAGLAEAAIWHGDQCTWLGRCAAEMRSASAPIVPTMRSLGPELYAGTAGVALFLAEEYGISRAERSLHAACGALRHARARSVDNQDDGFFSGTGGVAYVCMRVGQILDDRRLENEGIDLLVDCARRLAGRAEVLDLVSGLTGVVPSLFAAAGRRRAAIEIAVSSCRAIVRHASRQAAEGVGDPAHVVVGSGNKHMLTGFAHGAAGVAFALLVGHASTGFAEFRLAAEGALAYEEQWFIAERDNWPDLRSFAPAELPATPKQRLQMSCGETWCHGAPGIALTLAMALRVLGDNSLLRARLESAVRTTTRAIERWRPGEDVTPCHGLSGLLECLQIGSAALADAEAGAVAARACAAMVRTYENDAWWPSGVPSRGMSPSFMVGMAGVGHYLLRSATPAAVPSLLVPTLAMSRTR